MGLKLKAKENFKIVIQGTDIEIPNIYIRTRYLREIVGNVLEVQANIYHDKSKYQYDINKTINVNITDFNNEIIQHIPANFNVGKISISEENTLTDLEISLEAVQTIFNNFLEIDSNV